MRLIEVGRVLLLGVGALVGLGLVADATNYTLSPADPRTGRQRGCFTVADELLGLSQPAGVTRMGEGLLGGVLLLAPFVMGRLRHLERRSSRHAPGVAGR